MGLAARDAVVGELRDKVQIHQPDSLDSLEKHLRMHLLRLEMTRDAAKWRRVRRFGIRFVGGISAQVLWLSILFWLGVSAGALLFGKARLIAALVSLAPSRDWIGMLGGMPLVWAYLIPLAMLMQGWKHGLTVMARTSRVWWLVFALAVVKASIWLPQQIHCAKGAIAAGATLGLLMEISRRGKEKGARRNLLSVGREIARMSSLPRSIMQPGRADPRQWPLFVSGSKVFISYSRSSKWGNASADLLHQRLKSVGADSFLDRQSIPPGASWQYQLDEQIGDVPVFIAFCDGCSVERPWVAAEVAAALAGRHSSGFPEIFLVREPSLTPSVLDRSLPVFRDVFRWAEAGSEGAPQVITVRDENSIVNLAASLAPGRLQRAAVFPEGFRLFLIALTFPHIFLSSLVPILGLPALLVGISVQLGKVDLDAWFGPATLWWIAVAGAYALGTTIRQAIGARYDGVGQRQDRLSFAAMRLFAIGFAALGAHLWRRIDGVGLAWAATALFWLGSVGYVQSSSVAARSVTGISRCQVGTARSHGSGGGGAGLLDGRSNRRRHRSAGFR